MTLLLCACGSDPGATAMVLAEAYDLTGVARVLPDGEATTELLPFSWRLLGLTSGGGQLQGSLVLSAKSSTIALFGQIDGTTGELIFVPFTAALTSSTAESVEQLGGTGFDGSPKDGVAEELTGFLRTVQGRRLVRGSFVGSARSAEQPARPDPMKITAQVRSFGVVTVTGEAGAVPKRSLVEAFVYYFASDVPRFQSFVAEADGSFTGDLEGLEGDRLLLRARLAGIPSEGVVVTVER